MSIAPAVVYGQGQMVSTYSGPSLRVVRASDSTTLDIPNASRALDVSGVASFGSGTTMAVDLWYDQSVAAGGNATQTTGSQRPTFRLANAMKGNYPFTLDGTSAGIDLPAIVTDRRNVSILAVVCIAGNANTATALMRLGSDATYANNLNIYSSGTIVAGMGHQSGNSDQGIAVNPNVGLPAPFGFKGGSGRPSASVDNGGAALYEGGITSGGGNGAVAAGSLTGGRIGPSGATSTDRVANHWLFLAVYPGLLSDADFADFSAWASHRFGTLASPIAPQIIFDGDSITAGPARSDSFFGRQIEYQMQQVSTKSFKAGMAAVSGQLLSAMYSHRATTFGLYSASRVQNLYYLHGGTNDIDFGGATDMNALYTGSLVPLVQAAQTQGMATPIVGTVLPRNSFGATKWGYAKAFNTLIRNGAATYGYIVADYAGNASFLTDDTTGATNSTYYSDGIHPNEAGYALMEPILSAAMVTAGWTTPVLAPLAFSRPFFVPGVASSGPIGGAYPGSTLSATSLPTGLTIDSANRRWVWDGTGTSALNSFTLTETLAGATGSPRNTTVNYAIGNAYDTFTELRDENLSLHYSEDRGTWITQPGESGGANITPLSRVKTFAGKSVHQHSATLANDQTVSANIVSVGTPPGSNAAGIIARADSSVGTYYRFRYIQGSGYQLHSVVATVATQRGSTVAGAMGKMTLEVSGTANPVVVCKLDGVAIITFTHTGAPAGLTGGGKAGIYFEVSAFDTDSYQLTDFQAGPL